MSATWRTVPGPIEGSRIAELVCDHGTTSVQLQPGQPASVGVLASLVSRHVVAFDCTCVAGISPRPGAAPVLADGGGLWG